MSERPSIGITTLSDISLGKITEKPRQDYASWVEIQSSLNPSQRSAAEAVFFGAVLKKSIEEYQRELPWLTRRSRQFGSSLNAGNMLAGFLDAQIAPTLGEEGMKKFRGNWGGLDSDYLLHRANRINIELEGERDRIFAQAQGWQKDGEKKAVRRVYKYVNKLPKEQRQLLLERTGLKDKSGGLVKTIGTNTGIFLASEWPLLAAGAAGGYTDPLGVVGIENHFALALILLGSYYPYVKGLVRTGKADYELLHERGISSTAFSERAYNLADRITNNEKASKVAAHIGFGTWYLLLEAPYIGEAVVSVAASGKISSGISAAVTATLAAASLASWQADATEVGRTEGFNVDLAKKVAKLKYERNKDRFTKVKNSFRRTR